MYTIIWLVVASLILAVMFFCLIKWYPKYVLIAYNRFMMLILGISRKSVTITPTLSIAYMERGPTSSDTPTLLLIHGFGVSKECFIPLFRFLPMQIRVLALDLPGHGESGMKEKEDFSIRSFVQHVKQFVDSGGISRSKFHIMGASMGGHIAGMYAITYPDDLRSVILMCPHGIKNKHEEVFIKKLLEKGELVLVPDTKDDFYEMQKVLFNKDIRIPELIVLGALQMNREKFEIFKRVGMALREEENLYLLERNLNKLNTPLFVIWGKEDKILDVGCVDVIKSKLTTPAKKIVVIEDGGHVMVLERPRQCASLVMEFLDTFQMN